MQLPYALQVFLLLSSGLTILSFVYTLLCRRLNMGLPYSFPYYYVPGDMFNDFFLFRDKFQYWGTAEFFRHDPAAGGYFMYPSPLAHVFHLLLSMPHPRSCFALLMLAVVAFLAGGLVRALSGEGLPARASVLFVAGATLLSYPLVFVMQRWNIEVILWLISSLAVWSFFTGRLARPAILVGVAASMKFYPFIFLGLFLPRRRYGAFALGVAVFAGVMLLSLYSLGPTVADAARWDDDQIAAFTKYYVGSTWGLGYDHSFYGLVKTATLHWHPDYFAWVHRYTVTVALAAVGIYFLRIWRLPLPNQILALSVLSVTLAPISYDYTLLNLYPAFAMLAVLAVRAERGAPGVPYLTAYMALFAMIFTPQSYIILSGVRYGAQARALCLIAVLLLALTAPIPWEEQTAGEAERAASAFQARWDRWCGGICLRLGLGPETGC